MYPEDTPILTREDAVRFMEGPDAREPSGMKPDEIIRRDGICEFAKYFRRTSSFGDLAARRGCTLTRGKSKPCACALWASPSCITRASRGRQTDMDEKRFLEQLDFWMESQSLRKLGD
jgi:hypothetical protein